MASPHSVRKHSKYSASGADRWFACPGSVALSEGKEDTYSEAALVGTRGHEVLECTLKGKPIPNLKTVPTEMMEHVGKSAHYILSRKAAARTGGMLVETKVDLSFIHPEAFGTLDVAITEYFGTLDIIDFKYGKHAVSPRANKQLLFYALGVAHEYSWNFKTARLTIIQPRVRKKPVFWELPIKNLRKQEDVFRRAIDRVEDEPGTYKEGSHCYFCKGRLECPLKQEGQASSAKSAFEAFPLDEET